MVWKSPEMFGNLSLEKYGILKWEMKTGTLLAESFDAFK